MISRNALKATKAEAAKPAPVSFIETHRAHREAQRGLIPAAWQKKTGRAASLVESFYHAFHGIYLGLKQERNLRIHFCAAILCTVLGLYLKLDMISWLALALAIGLVIIAEFLNTALEHLVDLASRGQYHRSARYAKDTAAGAVLIAAFVAAITGSVIFLPKLAVLILHN
jgi:undecaprenol kinase